MVVPDINLLVYAYNSSSPHHVQARIWWENLLNGGTPVGLLWVVAIGFIRIMMDSRITNRPMNPRKTVGLVQKWLGAPGVSILEPGPRHLEIIAGRLTTDIHITERFIPRTGNSTAFPRSVGIIQ